MVELWKMEDFSKFCTLIMLMAVSTKFTFETVSNFGDRIISQRFFNHSEI